MDFSKFDQRPIIVAIAGPNGAGKTTFFFTHLLQCGLRFVNADMLAVEFGLEAYESANLAEQIRRNLVEERESFVFETVFSDPVGDKVAFLKRAVECGFVVVLCFIALQKFEQSIERVAMRVTQGGHDVPDDKLRQRFARSIANLKRAISELPHVLVFDNSDLNQPYRRLAVFENGLPLEVSELLPEWFSSWPTGRDKR